mmetsp:Transcript_25744/g.38666  ORF Transcript_25744/g.38666 Transcript_25744/m.38666 type:complete len:103 (+) Transcript_25744:17-325(+)
MASFDACRVRLIEAKEIRNRVLFHYNCAVELSSFFSMQTEMSTSQCLAHGSLFLLYHSCEVLTRVSLSLGFLMTHHCNTQQNNVLKDKNGGGRNFPIRHLSF